MNARRAIWRAVRVTSLLAWAYVMVVVGVLAMFEWPARFPSLDVFLLSAGIVLLCAGQFVLAVTAGGMFPKANPRFSGLMELLPWIVAPVALVVVLQ